MNLLKFFLSGSVKKGELDNRTAISFWDSYDIESIKNGVNFNIEIHNPNDLKIDLADSRNRFITDLKELLSSDFIIVNAITKKGIGVGAEMYIARYHKIPVYTIAPLESYYHKINEFGNEWFHPFIYELSNLIFDSIPNLIDYLNQMHKKGKLMKRGYSSEYINRLIDEIFGFDAGYDDGYKFTENFWGIHPAAFVTEAVNLIKKENDTNLNALDLGCGHGKNALFMQKNGFIVKAVDCSVYSIEQARNLSSEIIWEVEDIRKIKLATDFYNLIIMTGSLHCLDCKEQIVDVIRNVQNATKLGGYNVLSAFNDRNQLIKGHSSNFFPCLLSHKEYVDLYQNWEIIKVSDTDLDDIHPNTKIKHFHSITRLIAKKI